MYFLVIDFVIFFYCLKYFQYGLSPRQFCSNGRKQRGTKRLLMRVKVENEKAGLKSSIQKTKIRASSPIASWQIDGKKWKQ